MSVLRLCSKSKKLSAGQSRPAELFTSDEQAGLFLEQAGEDFQRLALQFQL
jgi:hypothetical protein